MFEIYKKKVTIKEKEYELLPLPGELLPKLYTLAIAMERHKDDLLNNLSEKQLEDMVFLCNETMKTSYPSEDKQKLNLFVSQNFMSIIPAVVDVNMNNEDRS